MPPETRNETKNARPAGAGKMVVPNSKGDDLVSISEDELREASRGLRIHVKESETKTNANNNFALAA